jgi:hypothetical protein
MSNITIVCFVLMVIFIVLLMKSKFKGSVLGKKAATILYVIGAGFYLGLFAYSLTQDIKAVSVSTKVQEHSLPINRAGNVENKDNNKGKSENKEKHRGKVIGDKDSKIYHVPGSTYYEKELQKESNNEYFNTAKEAEAAGYRAPKR